MSEAPRRNFFGTDATPGSFRLLFGCLGFTLIELIAVVALVALLASLSIPKFIGFEGSASKQALASAVDLLNSRESLTWSRIKLTPSGWCDDADVFSQINTDLGAEYKWSPKARIDGGILHYRDQMIKLSRSPSTVNGIGRWEVRSYSN